MDAAMPALWPQDDPLFDLNPPRCEVASHRDGPCPVPGLESILDELEMLALSAAVRRDARLTLPEHRWEVVAEDAGVRVVIPA